MSDICGFSIEIEGDVDLLQEFKRFLERGVEKVDRADERFVLHVGRLYDDLQRNEEHECLWLSDRHPGPKCDQFTFAEGPFWFTTDRSRMLIHGAAKWAPPRPLVERLSRAFPDLSFTFGGTTEHTHCEEWACKAGVSECQSQFVEDIRAEKTMWYVRDGHKVQSPEWIDSASAS